MLVKAIVKVYLNLFATFEIIIAKCSNYLVKNWWKFKYILAFLNSFIELHVIKKLVDKPKLITMKSPK